MPLIESSEAGPSVPSKACSPFEERLEQGELLHFPRCPFALPEGDDRSFLCQQRLGGSAHKNISFDPASGHVAGHRRLSAPQAQRLRGLLTEFSRRATAWLAGALPRYATSWKLDRVSFRPEEEATRHLRWNARNDLLHIDAFPSRPTQGCRILRLYVNLNPHEPRMWVTSETFDRLLEKYGAAAGLPTHHPTHWARRIGEGVLSLFDPGRRQRIDYDSFMLRFHTFLKFHDRFQDHGLKRFWCFAPGSAWLLFSDGLSYADLRGQFALDHSYFVQPTSLVFPWQSPAALLEKMCGLPAMARAA